MSNKILFIFKIVISACLLTYLLFLLDFSATLSIIKNATFLPLVGVFAIMFTDSIINAYLLKRLAHLRQSTMSLSNFLKLYLISGFWGAFLPSGFGTDIAMTYKLSKSSLNLTDSMSNVLLLRIYTSLPLFVFAFIATFFLIGLHSLRQQELYGILFFCVLYFIAFTIVTQKTSLRLLGTIFEKLKYIFISQKIGQFIALSTTLKEQGEQKIIICLAFLSKFLSVFSVYLICLSINVDIDLIYLFAFVPVITIATMIPISISGIGVREFSFAFLFSNAGFVKEESISVSIILFTSTIALNLLGGLIQLFEIYLSKKTSISR